MIKRIIFIRHGETVDNSRGVAQGWSDSALSELGQKQVRRLAGRMRSLGVTHLFSSTLPRAETTARAIAETTGLRFEMMEQFQEMNCGDWEGMSFDLIRRGDPDFHKSWSSDPSVACPGGESFEHVRERLRSGLSELTERVGNNAGEATVAIVSHGTAIRIAATVMLALPLSAARQFAQDNTALNIFDWRDDRYVLKVWNDASHCNEAD